MITPHPDEIIFAADEDNPNTVPLGAINPWKVMIVDDEPAVHEVTKIALKGVTFANRPLQFIDCYSGAEACKEAENHPDTALILLDVVMETDHAGLKVAKYVRETLDNKTVRIVLRTGQPGQAPERDIIVTYDINDYKEKTELTSSKLFTLIYSSLRSYQDITTIEAGRRGLAQVIEASADIFKLSALDRFAKGVLEQLAALVRADPDALYLKSKSTQDTPLRYDKTQWHVVAGTGAYTSLRNAGDHAAFIDRRSDLLDKALRERKSVHINQSYAAYFEDRLGNISVLLLDGLHSTIKPLESDLIQLFLRNVSIAFENINLHSDLEETQREIVCLLGEAVERRSRETGNHVRRVAAISEMLANKYGLSAHEAQTLRYASPLHDVGKIAIPDEVLNKPGPHTAEETAIMHTHAEIGYQMLASSQREVLRAAAIVAQEHHEHWDGCGYPQNKAGSDIHIYGRITAVADVVDALLNDRCYKKAWPLQKVLDLFKEERGKQFEPKLVDILFENLTALEEIQSRYRDTF